MLSTIALARVPALFVMGPGYFAGKEKIVDNRHVQSLNTLLMTFALPLSLFIAMAETPAGRFSSGFYLGLVLTISMLILFATGTIFIGPLSLIMLESQAAGAGNTSPLRRSIMAFLHAIAYDD